MNIKTLFAAAALAATSVAANAATFDFTTGSGNTSSWTVASNEEPSATVEVTGWRRDSICGIFCVTYAQRSVTRDSTGIGVTGPFDTDSDLDGQINEYLEFTFSKPVDFVSIFFSDIDRDDDYRLYADTGSGFFQFDSGDSPEYLFSTALTSQFLRIGATGGEDSFRVASISAQVPVPAAGFLLVGALGGLAALRRKRKAA